ncbi:hypothetical protein AB0G74_24060 [Streptomyces sp. NPDC020875]|uniref:hypothetical protein n=1 Tax=Streptomyces sp. NPDC020875 TaxID=3154898 RepID=UPI0033D4DCF0
MQRVRVPHDVTELLAGAVRDRGWTGPAHHAVGGRERNGSWRQAAAIGAVALLVGTLTTWGLIQVRDELDGRVALGLGFGYLITLIVGLAAVAHRPGPERPAVWIQLYEDGLAHYRQGAHRPTVLAWDEIQRADHHITRIEDSSGREVRRVHSLSVTPVPDPVRRVRRGTVALPPGFPDAEVLARYITGRTR